MRSFNINQNVKVKLKQAAIDIMRSNHDRLFAGRLDKYPFREPKVDEEGYVIFQLWSLMQEFGTSLSLGAIVPFETEILLLEEK